MAFDDVIISPLVFTRGERPYTDDRWRRALADSGDRLRLSGTSGGGGGAESKKDMSSSMAASGKSAALLNRTARIYGSERHGAMNAKKRKEREKGKEGKGKRLEEREERTPLWKICCPTKSHSADL
jgi:hypothetical protein